MGFSVRINFLLFHLSLHVQYQCGQVFHGSDNLCMHVPFQQHLSQSMLSLIVRASNQRNPLDLLNFIYQLANTELSELSVKFSVLLHLPCTCTVYRHDRPGSYGGVFLGCRSTFVTEKVLLKTSCKIVSLYSQCGCLHGLDKIGTAVTSVVVCRTISSIIMEPLAIANCDCLRKPGFHAHPIS